MIVAADHMGDAHVMIVDDDGEHVGWRAVGAEQDEIVNLRILHDDPPLHEIVDDRLALLRRLQPHDIGAVALGPAVPPRAADPERPPLRLRRLALRGQLFLAHPAFIGMTVRQQLVGHLRMAIRIFGLEMRLTVPVQPEPGHAVEDRVDRRLSGARLVRILDPQHEAAAMMARIEPVEERSAGAADMQEPRRRGGETGHNLACAHAFILQQQGAWRPVTRGPLA